MANQRDVAKLAGVSSASVSRFINNPETVSPESAERIKSAIKTLSYRIDHSALSLKTGKYYRIGIIAASYGSFYLEILSTLEELLSEAGYYCNIHFTRQFDFENVYKSFNVSKLLNKQADGYIFFPLLTQSDDRIIETLQGMNEPLVVVDRPVSSAKVYQVLMDNYNAGCISARTLLAAGRTRFLFIWGLRDISSSVERFNGFSDELKKNGIELAADRQLDGNFDPELTYTIAKQSNLPDFDGVFASNDYSASGFIKAAAEKGLQAPTDYSIIGFDNNPVSPFLTPSLSTFSQPLREFGRVAAQKLLAIISGEKTSRVEILTPRYIERGSVKL